MQKASFRPARRIQESSCPAPPFTHRTPQRACSASVLPVSLAVDVVRLRAVAVEVHSAIAAAVEPGIADLLEKAVTVRFLHSKVPEPL